MQCTSSLSQEGTAASLHRGKSAIDVKLLSAAQVGRVAQLAEQCPFKAWVDGSSPSALTKYFIDSAGFLLH